MVHSPCFYIPVLSIVTYMGIHQMGIHQEPLVTRYGELTPFGHGVEGTGVEVIELGSWYCRCRWKLIYWSFYVIFVDFIPRRPSLGRWIYHLVGFSAGAHPAVEPEVAAGRATADGSVLPEILGG